MINCRGEVVALNAGGKNKAASAFYLPLERVVRALRLLQARTGWPHLLFTCMITGHRTMLPNL